MNYSSIRQAIKDRYGALLEGVALLFAKDTLTPEEEASVEQSRKEYERGVYKTLDELKDLTKE